jgi:hypothetical protein
MLRKPVAVLILAIIASCGVPSTPERASAEASTERTPVIVELFSSEGCSSCPPADVVLRDLERSQLTPRAEVIGLELHVDYWNYLGWQDPFSNDVYTARQRAYADAFGQRGVYTPQMIVDGQTELVGSDKAAAKRAIAAAAKAPKAKVQLTRAGDRVRVAVGELPEMSGMASVWLAITEQGLRTAVARGENAGSTLVHAPVVRRLKKLGTIPRWMSGPAFAGESDVAVEPSWKRENLRAVAFVQRHKTLQILGAAALSLQ